MLNEEKVKNTKKYLMYLLENTSSHESIKSIEVFMNMLNSENADSVLKSAEKLAIDIAEENAPKTIRGKQMSYVSSTPELQGLIDELTNNSSIGELMGLEDKKSNYANFINNLDKIDDISNLEDEQILKLRDKLKEIDGKLKEKAKPKTITISGEAHGVIKTHCSSLNESIGEWSEKILLENVKPKRYRILTIKLNSEEILHSVKNAIQKIGQKEGLITTINKECSFIYSSLIGKLEFLGFSRIHGQPIFRYFQSEEIFEQSKCTFPRDRSMGSFIKEIFGVNIENMFTLELIAAIEDHIVGYKHNEKEKKDEDDKFLSLIENSITYNNIFPKTLPSDIICKFVETQGLPMFRMSFGIYDIYNPYFIKYVIGWAKVQQGNMFSRYDYTLPGGVTVNSSDMIAEGKEEMSEAFQLAASYFLNLTATKNISETNIVLIPYPRHEINGVVYKVGTMECSTLDDFFQKQKNAVEQRKTIYLYSISHKDEGISMSGQGNLLKIRYFIK